MEEQKNHCSSSKYLIKIISICEHLGQKLGVFGHLMIQIKCQIFVKFLYVKNKYKKKNSKITVLLQNII